MWQNLSSVLITLKNGHQEDPALQPPDAHLSPPNSHYTLPYKHGVYVSHRGLVIYYIKKYLKAKEKIMETQIFHHEKNIIFKKILQTKPNSLKILYNSITNPKFQHKPKYHLSKILIIKLKK